MLDENSTLSELDEWLASRRLKVALDPAGHENASWSALVQRGDIGWTGTGPTMTQALLHALDAYSTIDSVRTVRGRDLKALKAAR